MENAWQVRVEFLSYLRKISALWCGRKADLDSSEDPAAWPVERGRTRSPAVRQTSGIERSPGRTRSGTEKRAGAEAPVPHYRHVRPIGQSADSGRDVACVANVNAAAIVDRVPTYVPSTDTRTIVRSHNWMCGSVDTVTVRPFNVKFMDAPNRIV